MRYIQEDISLSWDNFGNRFLKLSFIQDFLFPFPVLAALLYIISLYTKYFFFWNYGNMIFCFFFSLTFDFLKIFVAKKSWSMSEYVPLKVNRRGYGGDAGRRPHSPEPLRGRGGRGIHLSKKDSQFFPFILRNVSIKSGKYINHDKESGLILKRLF